MTGVFGQAVETVQQILYYGDDGVDGMDLRFHADSQAVDSFVQPRKHTVSSHQEQRSFRNSRGGSNDFQDEFLGKKMENIARIYIVT